MFGISDSTWFMEMLQFPHFLQCCRMRVNNSKPSMKCVLIKSGNKDYQKIHISMTVCLNKCICIKARAWKLVILEV